MSKKSELPDGHPLKPFQAVIVTGTRDWTDYSFVFKTLNKIREKDGIDAIITADEKGVSDFAIEWAIAKHLPYIVWPTNPADGDEACLARAGRMLQRHRTSSQLIAFPGGYVTDWMASNAKRIHSMRVQYVNPPK